MRVQSKQCLMESIDETWRSLWTPVDATDGSHLELRICIDGVESDSVKDILAHLHGWLLLLLNWTKSKPGSVIELPAKGFKWNQTRELNRFIFSAWRDVEIRSVCRRLKLSHNRVVEFVSRLSESELLDPGHFSWTKKNPIVIYIAPNTASHYRWATKKIKHLQNRFVGH